MVYVVVDLPEKKSKMFFGCKSIEESHSSVIAVGVKYSVSNTMMEFLGYYHEKNTPNYSYPSHNATAYKIKKEAVDKFISLLVNNTNDEVMMKSVFEDVPLAGFEIESLIALFSKDD